MIGVLASHIHVQRDLRIHGNVNKNKNKNVNKNVTPDDDDDAVDDDLSWFLQYDVVFVDAIFDSVRIKDLGESLIPILPFTVQEHVTMPNKSLSISPFN